MSKQSLIFFRFLWLSILVFCAYFLIFSGINLNSDIHQLLLKDKKHSEFAVGKHLLEKNASTFRFALEGDETEQVEDAAYKLKKSLKALSLNTRSYNEKKELFLNNFSQSRAYFLDNYSLELLTQPDTAQRVLENISSKLSSPLGHLYAQLLERDPLLLSTERLIKLTQMERGEEHEGVIFFDEQNSLSAIVLANWSNTAPSMADHKKIVQQLEDVISELEKSYPDVNFLWSAISRFVDSSASRLESDINLLSTLALLFTVILILSVFGSLRPVFLSLFSVGCGMLFAIFICNKFLGGIHLLTLGFGGSLMGACVDYAIHYQCFSYFPETEKSFKATIRSIIVGAGTSILAFLFLLYSDFPGLTELSLFCASSLFASVLSVLLFFPLISKKSQASKRVFAPKLILSIFELLAKAGKQKKFITLTIYLFLLGLISLTRIEFNDDIRLLQKPESELIQNERWLEAKLSPGEQSGMLLVSADSREKLQRVVENTCDFLADSNFSKQYLGLCPFLDTQDKRTISINTYRNFIQEHFSTLELGLQNIGYSKELTQKALSLSKQVEPTLDSISHILSEGFFANFLPIEVNNRLYSAIALFDLKNKEQLRSALSKLELEKGSDVIYYSHPQAIASLFSSYRERAVFCVGLSYIFILLILFIYLRPQEGSADTNSCNTQWALQSIISCHTLHSNKFLYYSCSSHCAGTIRRLHCLYGRGERNSKISIGISSLTTAISFALLSFSSTPVSAVLWDYNRNRSRFGIFVLCDDKTLY